jgi:TetR/AcrR family transcriptional repressor of nem operon
MDPAPSWVEKLIRDAGEAFVSEVDPRNMAAFVLAVMEGAVMQARASRSIEPFDSAIETLRDYVRRVLKQKKETEQT